MNSSCENFTYWSSSLITCGVYKYLKDVARAGATVEERVRWIDFQTVYESLVMSKLTVKRLEFVICFIKGPELDSSIMTSYESIWRFIEELYVKAFLLVLVSCGLSTF